MIFLKNTLTYNEEMHNFFINNKVTAMDNLTVLLDLLGNKSKIIFSVFPFKDASKITKDSFKSKNMAIYILNKDDRVRFCTQKLISVFWHVPKTIYYKVK